MMMRPRRQSRAQRWWLTWLALPSPVRIAAVILVVVLLGRCAG